MKSIHGWGDLRRYGINLLTGEACAIGMRGLCDVSEKGMADLRQFWGLAHDARFQSNWNSGAAGSCFISYGAFNELSAFLLLMDGCEAVAVTDRGIFGLEKGDEAGRMIGDVKRWYRRVEGQEERNLSSVHAMSGRAQ